MHPEEFAQLFNAILINVTAFFRDEPAWAYLRGRVASSCSPPMAALFACGAPAARPGKRPTRIAMLLAEALGREALRERVKDVRDRHRRARVESGARRELYREAGCGGPAGAAARRYFARDGDRYIFDKELRRSVIFGRHDLIHDAPISRVNLLMCRNTLMYFNTEAQGRILARLHFALADDGVLFLGKAEMLLDASRAVRADRSAASPFQEGGQGELARPAAPSWVTWEDEDDRSVRGGSRLRISQRAFDASPHAQLVIDDDGAAGPVQRARALAVRHRLRDIGRPLQDLELSYRPIELRIAHHAGACGASACRGSQTAAFENSAREPRFFDVNVVPLPADDGAVSASRVSFTDVTRVRDLQTQLARSKQDLETAYEELQSTNEELETTNEELQSTVEELETTNEELQSTNEELETMNEELQSSNEELQTMNEELRDRSDDLNRANGFFESILTGVRSGVVVIDRDLRVTAWNHRAEDLWGCAPTKCTARIS